MLIEPHGFCLENGDLGESWEPQSSKKNTTVSTIIRIFDVPEKQPMAVLGTSIQPKNITVSAIIRIFDVPEGRPMEELGTSIYQKNDSLSHGSQGAKHLKFFSRPTARLPTTLTFWPADPCQPAMAVKRQATKVFVEPTAATHTIRQHSGLPASLGSQGAKHPRFFGRTHKSI